MISNEARARYEKSGFDYVKTMVEKHDQDFTVFAPELGARMMAAEWINEQQRIREENRFQAAIQPVIDTARSSRHAVFVAIAVGIISGIFGYVQLQDAQKSRDEQMRSAKELLSVEIAIALDKEWDSLEMRQARRRLARQLLEKRKITESRIANFFDKVGMYVVQKRIDDLTAYEEFGDITDYWPALKQSVIDWRKIDGEPDEYAYFEQFYSAVVTMDAERNRRSVEDSTPSKQDVLDYLKDEENLTP